jgi:hypothetical protein
VFASPEFNQARLLSVPKPDVIPSFVFEATLVAQIANMATTKTTIIPYSILIWLWFVIFTQGKKIFIEKKNKYTNTICRQTPPRSGVTE